LQTWKCRLPPLSRADLAPGRRGCQFCRAAGVSLARGCNAGVPGRFIGGLWHIGRICSRLGRPGLVGDANWGGGVGSPGVCCQRSTPSGLDPVRCLGAGAAGGLDRVSCFAVSVPLWSGKPASRQDFLGGAGAAGRSRPFDGLCPAPADWPCGPACTMAARPG